MIKWRSRETRDKLFDAVKYGKTIVLYDLETTGLKSDKDLIIQFSAIKLRFNNGIPEEVERIDTYINPEIPIPPKITEITGINDETVFGKPKESEIFPKIKEFFGDNFVASGYNVAKFDNNFMKYMYERNNSVFSPEYTIDVLEMARDNVESSATENFKLISIASLYGVDKGLTFHNAMDDIIATKNLLVVFNEEYKTSYNEDEGLNTKDVSANTSKKQIQQVLSINFWEGYRGFSRIYITTNIGDFYYDIRKRIWCTSQKNNPYSVDEVDMDSLKCLVFKKCDANSEDEFVKKYTPRKTDIISVGNVNSMKYWQKEDEFRSIHRIYIETDAGNFFYDIDKKTWNKGNENPNVNIDFEELKSLCFKMANVSSEDEFANYR